jgi:hypothetical protein
MVKIINKAQYYDDIKFIAEDFDEKLKKASLSLSTESNDFIHNLEYINLLEEFLLTPDSIYNKKFLPLKENYHKILVKMLNEAKIYQDSITKIKSRDGSKQYFDILSELGKVYTQSSNFVENYRLFKDHVETNALRFIQKSHQQKKYIDYLLKGAAATSPMPITIGFFHILDCYRRCAELIRVPMRDIRKTIQLKNKETIQSSSENYNSDIEIIKNDKLCAELTKSIIPLLRHSESHLFTRIDEDSQKIYTFNEITKKEVDFTPDDINQKWKDILHNLVPSLIIFYVLTDLALKIVCLRSEEFLTRIVLIGNCKK